MSRFPFTVLKVTGTMWLKCTMIGKDSEWSSNILDQTFACCKGSHKHPISNNKYDNRLSLRSTLGTVIDAFYQISKYAYLPSRDTIFETNVRHRNPVFRNPQRDEGDDVGIDRVQCIGY